MGTFAGHALPGSFFIVASLWWTCSTYYNWAKAKKTNSRYRSSLAFTIARFPNVPIESYIKLFFCAVGVTGETVTGLDKNGIFVHMGNGQHITMFSFFGLQAIVEIFSFYKFSVPPNIEYASSVLAFIMEGLLFIYHLHGRSALDIRVHMLLVYVIFACAIAVVLEGVYRQNVLFPLFRTYAVLLQGTWFYQVGFILYPPFPGMEQWAEHDHNQMMIVTMVFTWHCAVNFVLMLLIGMLVTRHTRWTAFESSSKHSLLPTKKPTKENGLLTHSDSESDEI